MARGYWFAFEIQRTKVPVEEPTVRLAEATELVLMKFKVEAVDVPVAASATSDL